MHQIRIINEYFRPDGPPKSAFSSRTALHNSCFALLLGWLFFFFSLLPLLGYKKEDLVSKTHFVFSIPFKPSLFRLRLVSGFGLEWHFSFKTENWFIVIIKWKVSKQFFFIDPWKKFVQYCKNINNFNSLCIVSMEK